MRIERHKAIIRDAEEDDIGGIADLWWELFAFHADLDPIFTPSPNGREHYRRYIKYHLSDKESIVLVIEHERRLLGYLLAQIQSMPPVMACRKIGFIADVAVTSEARGAGLGRKLYQEAERRMRDLGVARLELKTSSFNPLSNYFWEEVCGFKEFVKIRYKEL